MTRSEAAVALGVSERTLDRWRIEDGFPVSENGYDIDAIKDWRDARHLREASASREQDSLEQSIRELKLKALQSKNRLLQLRIEEHGKDLPPTGGSHVESLARAKLFSALAELVDVVTKRFGVIVQEAIGREAK